MFSGVCAPPHLAQVNEAEEERLQRIRDGCVAYILSKAADLGLEAQAEVTVGEDGCPESVTIRAAPSPVERQELTGIIPANGQFPDLLSLKIQDTRS